MSPMLSMYPVLLLSLCLAVPSYAELDRSDPKVLSEQHLKKLRDDINDLQSFLKKAQDSHQELVSDLKKSDESVSKISQDVERLKQKLQEERDRLKKLKAQQRTLNQQQAKQQSILKDIVIATYKLGQEPQLKLLLNQQDASQLARNMNYLQYFNQAHQQQIQQYRTTLLEVDSVAKEVQIREQSLQSNFAELTYQHQQLRSKQLQQRQQAHKLNQSIKSSDEKLARLQQDRQQLIDLLGKVEEVFLPYERSQESRPFKSLKGQLPNPIGATPQRLFGKWQQNGLQKWQGWLYKGNAGQPVRAIHHGRVVFSDWLRGFGLLTIVDHGQGFMSLYARNQALLRSVGDWVETGDVISRLGRSGGYDDDNLYFEIRYKGSPQNPRVWIKAS